MLVVEHFVGPSPIHGLGVFSRFFIPKEALVWRVHSIFDREISKNELLFLPQHVVQSIFTHAEYLPARDIFRLSADGAFYMNHSDDPNVLDAGDVMHAARDIAAGEELLCDYRSVRVMAFDPDERTSPKQTAVSGEA